MTWTCDGVLTSDTAPGTAASNAKAADAKSCSFIIVIDGWVVFDYRLDRFMSPTNGSNMKSIAKRVACKRWTFDAKDSGIVLFLHGNLRWNGKLLKHWIESSDLFAQLWYLFLECQTKQHAASSGNQPVWTNKTMSDVVLARNAKMWPCLRTLT